MPPASATAPKATPVQASIPTEMSSPKAASQTPTPQLLGSPAGTSTVAKAAALPNQIQAQAAVPRLVSPVVRGNYYVDEMNANIPNYSIKSY